MREMVLNHASFEAPSKDIATDWLRDLIVAMIQLVGSGVVEATLRARHSHHEVHCLPGKSLFDISLELLHTGAPEEFRFFSTLSTKVPLLNDADPKASSRFLGCQNKTMIAEHGEPLLYCAIAGAVSVSFPSNDQWDKDSLTVDFEELVEGETWEQWSEEVDNIAQQQHAASIVSRHRGEVRETLRRSANGLAVWNRREEVFPHLRFGPDVETHLSTINPGELGTLINRLVSLDEAAAAWPLERGEVPPWKSKVTDENYSVKVNSKLREARRFRSYSGIAELFFWHARFGSHRRIHLRFDRATFTIEIGYIGNHLPLPAS